MRISSVDGVEGGLTLEDQIAFAREAKARGADLIDCSSRRACSARRPRRAIPRGYGFQVPYADEIRRAAEIATIAVGLILHPQQAEDVLASGRCRSGRDRPRGAVSIRTGRCMPSLRCAAEAARCSRPGPGSMVGGWSGASRSAQARRSAAAIPRRLTIPG